MLDYHIHSKKTERAIAELSSKAFHMAGYPSEYLTCIKELAKTWRCVEASWRVTVRTDKEEINPSYIEGTEKTDKLFN